MRNFIIPILFICLYAYPNETAGQQAFLVQWKTVDSLISKGLNRSALDKVRTIYTFSKQSKDQSQQIKSLLYIISLDQNLSEGADLKNIAWIEREANKSPKTAHAILYSIEAETYWEYYQQNRYKIYSRTATTNFNKNNIDTWSIVDFLKKISELYLISIADKTLLQQTDINVFNPIIIKGNTHDLRPTLYDFLVHRALNYFKNNEPDIANPAYAFEINDPEAFAPTPEFVHHNFTNKDTLSLQYKSILIFRDLLRFHLKDSNPSALIDADIERLQFVNQFATLENKQSLHIKALDILYNKYNSYPASAQAGFLEAQAILNYWNQKRQFNDSSSQLTINKAKNLAEEIKSKFPGSEGGINASNLLKQILHKELSLTIEKVNIPGEPFRALVKYKNIAQVFLKIIPVTPYLKDHLINNSTNDDWWKKLENQTFLKKWDQVLPLPEDYHEHSTEIKIDSLPVGEYIVLASALQNFDLTKNTLSSEYFYVSNISYVNNLNEYFIVNRKSGMPLEGAILNVFNTHYDYNSRKEILSKTTSLISNKNGNVKIINTKKTNQNFKIEITYKNDHLAINDYQFTYNRSQDFDDIQYDTNSNKYERLNVKNFIFTDRSIYRPGQWVYFKGIAVTKDFKSRTSKLFLSKDSITVLLNDANGQKIDSRRLLLNDFGSFNAKFKLPDNKLNGNYNIEVAEFNNSSVNFSVEEYKRPKFYATIDKLKSTQHLNEIIHISGSAKSYAGNNINGAIVKFRVTRITRFLFNWIWDYTPRPVTPDMEITNGEVKTTDNGSFEFEFKAIPDLSIPTNTNPVFDYDINVDITDMNGETRSGSLIVPVGYKSFSVNIGILPSESVNSDSLKNIMITTKNLSQEKIHADVNLKIYSLVSPERLIRKRYWQRPDQFVMKRENFQNDFPNDEYDNELDIATWKRSQLIYDKDDTSNKKFQIQNKLDPGWFVAEASAKDAEGLELKDTRYFQVYDLHNSVIPSKQYSWNNILKNEVNPGDDAIFLSGTSANNVFLIHQVEKHTPNSVQLSNEYQFFIINNEMKKFQFPVVETDRGSFAINQFFVKDNRLYAYHWNVIVPWTNKMLHTEFQTFRDKTLPGSEEKWKIKIMGDNAQKVSAEMLASMYDASLDQFQPHHWNPLDLWKNNLVNDNWNGNQNFNSVYSIQKSWEDRYVPINHKQYDQLIFNRPDNIFFRNKNVYNARIASTPGQQPQIQYAQSKIANEISGKASGQNINNILPSENNFDSAQIRVRKNFNETAFFFPEIRTDQNGNIELNFTLPESVTSWKLFTLAHTKDLATGFSQRTLVTQKELMVQPNVPRFLRNGDHIIFSTKIVNLSDKIFTGETQLQLYNATTMQPIDSSFHNTKNIKQFSSSSGQSSLIEYNIDVPKDFIAPVTFRFVATSGNTSDGEEGTIPVLSNRQLVTESLTLQMRGYGTKHFKFNKLADGNKSSTLSNRALKVEYTTNPVWYVVRALPYIMEYRYECAEQTFNRFYANSIAGKIVNTSPKIRAVFQNWNTMDTSALRSNLQKNQELKSVLLEETPWVLDAQNEAQQMKNISLLFDIVHLSGELEGTLNNLKDLQTSNGGFAWFKGGRDDQYITQYIISGIGHLKKLKALTNSQNETLSSVWNLAIPYLDKRNREEYENLKKYKTDLKNSPLNYINVQYLYMRSFFSEVPIAKENQDAYNYVKNQAMKFWLSQSKYMQGMIALALFRSGDVNTSKNIIRSLKENAINNEELGMYWKEWDYRGYWWHQAPIESQALMIEAFSEIDKDPQTIDDLKTWLLKNKQVNNWKTTRATAEACYALLLQGTNWIKEEKKVTIQLGDAIIKSEDQQQPEAIGYFKENIETGKIVPGMGNIKVTVASSTANNKENSSSSSWGAVYWQYFENLDKITFAETPLKLIKKLFIQTNTDRGPVISPVIEGTSLKVGDKIKVRIELRVDRDMEYIHMKDMRAANLEPVNVLSGYNYQGGLGYYESTKDASTNFFFDHLSKGTYVFEYPLFITHKGNFSNGITTIQCMYAPEFTAHSEGIRINVK